jgi:hypothetical protein
MEKNLLLAYAKKCSQTGLTCIDTCPAVQGMDFLVTCVGMFSQQRNNSLVTCARKCSEKMNLCRTTCLIFMENGFHVTYAGKFSQLEGSCINICLFIKWTNFLIIRARQCSQEGTARKAMCLLITLKIFLLTHARKRPKYKDLLQITESHLKIEHFIVICAINISKWSSCTYICLFIMDYPKKMDLLVNVASKYLWRRLAFGDICYFAKKCQKEECISAPIEPV